ncbi:MAG: hypothetical protein APF80_01630 [Alphaproteobacteria bacterium BRH_c36]|nr:MAG: hypothetical protein APF80_01630 [Alphaproteobacteria bacterium BRH_c36]
MLTTIWRSRDLVTAWAALAGLSAGTTLLAAFKDKGFDPNWLAFGILVLAGLKARLILGRYLGLRASRFWTRGFDLATGIFLITCFTLFVGAGKG